MQKHSLFKNTLVLTSSYVFNKVAMFVFIVFLARFLGSGEFGKFAFAFAFTQFFYQMADFGLNIFMIREISADKSRTNEVFVNSFLVRGVFAVFTILCIITIMLFLNKPSDVFYAVLFFSIAIVFNSMILSFFAVFRAFEKMIYEAIANILLVIGYVVLGTLFILYDASVAWIAVAYCISSCAVFVLCAYFLRVYFFVPQFTVSGKYFKKMIAEVWPFGLGILFTLGIYRIGVVLVSIILGDNETGWFQSVYSIVGSVNLVLGMVIAAAFPRLTSDFQLSVKQLNYQSGRIIKLIIIFTFPFIFLVSYFANTVVYLLFGSAYVPSVILLRIMIWTVLPFITANLFGNMLIVVKNEKKFAFGSIGIFIIAMVIYTGALMTWGMTGGAVATFIIDLVMAVIFGGMMYKLIEINKIICLKALLAIAVFCCVFIILRNLAWANVVISFIVYILTIKWLIIFQEQEIAFIKKVFPFSGRGLR
ncbi:MAG: oligosaccharide flippase family protein [Elusimicrobia bacterium]|nr:oligosaccharide flippase family protein [Elusimicrobiota bacterium]